MGAPRREPSGMINVVSTAQMQGKLECFGYGQDSRVINPGDMIIVAMDFVGENFHKQKIEFALKIYGRDMNLFVEASKNALALWNDNKHWLQASVNTPNLDQRSLSEIRMAENLANINSLYHPK
jgi:hypothetical protein